MMSRLNSRLPLRLLILFVGIYFLAILQDYIYSQLKLTGFYLSESALYNLYWMFFVPILILIARVLTYFKEYKLFFKIVIATVVAILLAILHAIIFTGFFTFVSAIVYQEPHRYSAMLKTIISNQFYLSVIIYGAFPFLVGSKQGPSKLDNDNLNHLLIKNGLKTDRVVMDQIIYVKTDRPYIVIITIDKRYIHNATLDAIMKDLKVNIFIRVHRSNIINKTKVVSLKSRKNGDFDAIMDNGDEVRLSRHYRNSWEELLHKA